MDIRQYTSIYIGAKPKPKTTGTITVCVVHIEPYGVNGQTNHSFIINSSRRICWYATRRYPSWIYVNIHQYTSAPNLSLKPLVPLQYPWYILNHTVSTV